MEIKFTEDEKNDLNSALKNYDDKEFMRLLYLKCKSVHGSMSYLSRKSNISRQSLQSILTGKTSPKLDTITILLEALGFHFLWGNQEYGYKGIIPAEIKQHREGK